MGFPNGDQACWRRANKFSVLLSGQPRLLLKRFFNSIILDSLPSPPEVMRLDGILLARDMIMPHRY
jgi:hypothetical protein